MHVLAREAKTYLDTVNSVARDVQVGDLLFGLRVRYSGPLSRWIWRIEADNETDQETPTAGISVDVTGDWPVTVTRQLTLGEDQCIVCKRHGIKYAAQHKCNACYQRERRQNQVAS